MDATNDNQIGGTMSFHEALRQQQDAIPRSEMMMNSQAQALVKQRENRLAFDRHYGALQHQQDADLRLQEIHRIMIQQQAALSRISATMRGQAVATSKQDAKTRRPKGLDRVVKQEAKPARRSAVSLQKRLLRSHFQAYPDKFTKIEPVTSSLETLTLTDKKFEPLHETFQVSAALRDGEGETLLPAQATEGAAEKDLKIIR